jgi:hypothetical protein
MATASDVNIKIKSFIGATNSTAAIYCPPPAVVATTSTLDGLSLTVPAANYGVLRVDTPQTFTSAPKFESDIQTLTLYNDGGASLNIKSFNFTFSLAPGRVVAPKFYGTTARSLISGTNITLAAGASTPFQLSYIAIAPGDYVNNLIFFSDAQNSEYQVNTYQSVSDAVNILQSTTTFITNTTILGEPNSVDVTFTKRVNGITYTGTNLTLIPTISGDPGWSVTTGTFNTVTVLWDPDQVNNNTGTYISTVTVAVFEMGENIGTKTITNISNVNIDYTRYGNLTSWISPASSYNSVIGISLDNINGQRVLTIGVGMGGDYSPRYDRGGYRVTTTYNLGFRARTVIPKFPYWANVWSFTLNEYNYTYLSGALDVNDNPKYIRKTTVGYDYEKYFGYQQSGAGYKSMFIVKHDGQGNISVALNNLRELSGDTEFDVTLRNLTRAFHYYSTSDNVGRYYQLADGPIGVGTRTLLFRGFDNLGNAVTSIVTLPDNIL